MTHEENVLVASRRRLLAVAGCLATIPSIAAAERMVPTTNHSSAQSGALTAKDANANLAFASIDPYFIETKAETDQHHARWMDLNERCTARRRTLRRWEERNPEPRSVAHPAWMRRHQQVMRSLQLAAVSTAKNEAAAAYKKAVTRFAVVEADNLAELLFKVQTAAITDTQDNKIARSVLFDILQLKREGDFSYRTACEERSAELANLRR